MPSWPSASRAWLARTSYDWRIAGDLVRTIDAIRSNIVDELGAKDPCAAVVRLWQLIDASHKIMEIVDDSRLTAEGWRLQAGQT